MRMTYVLLLLTASLAITATGYAGSNSGASSSGGGRTLSDYNIQKESTAQPPRRLRIRTR